MVFSTISPHHEHASCLVFSPLLSQFVTPCANPDKDDHKNRSPSHSPWSTATVGCVHIHAGREDIATQSRVRYTPITTEIPKFLYAGDFNCLVNPSLDTRGLRNETLWAWIRHGATATPLIWGTHLAWQAPRPVNTPDTPAALEVPPPDLIISSYPPPPWLSVLFWMLTSTPMIAPLTTTPPHAHCQWPLPRSIQRRSLKEVSGS